MEHPQKTGDYPQAADRQIDESLLQLTEDDPNGRFLMNYLCKLVEEHAAWDDTDRHRVYEALDCMYTVHGFERRENDDAYVTHPLRVAIHLCADGASSELVAAGLLHDTAEDSPEAVIDYIMTDDRVTAEDAAIISDAHRTYPSELPKGERVETAAGLIVLSPIFDGAGLLANGVTNRPYPKSILDIDDPHELRKAKHEYRAEQIQYYIQLGPEVALLKFFDTYDNIRSLKRHEGLKLDKLIKLHEKYSLMIDVWESLESTRPAKITQQRIDICKERLEEVQVLIDSRALQPIS